MEHLTWQRLALVAAATFALAWLITRVGLGDGYTPATIPWTLPVICIVGGVLSLVFAWPVRQFQRGKNPGLDGLRAARAAFSAREPEWKNWGSPKPSTVQPTVCGSTRTVRMFAFPTSPLIVRITVLAAASVQRRTDCRSIGLELKAVVDQFREQVQNLE